MVELRTEEEQLEAIKGWWKSNGNALITGVVVALVAVGGWKYYKHQNIETLTAASVKYQELVELIVEKPDGFSEADTANANAVFDVLKSEYSKTSYTQLAALLLAKQSIVNNDFDAALNQYNWILENSPSEDIAVMTTLRIAKIQFQKNMLDEALATLAKISGKLLSASVNELKGDIYSAKNDTNAAKAAYDAAQKIATEEDLYMPNLKLKLDELAVSDAEGA